MSKLNKHISIPKDVASANDLDYAFLRKKGLEYIEKLSGKVWTDYNSHDPGITILEMLCYAITDLGSRIDMPIEDILSPEDDSSYIKQFFDALQILPSQPVTVNDYRKMFIDIDGVHNCWLQKYQRKVYVNCKDGQLSYKPNEFNSLEEKDRDEFTIRGLYSILVDFESLDDETLATEDDIEEKLAPIRKKIFSTYHKNRNLCEDLIEVKAVKSHNVRVCASVELEPEANEEMVEAQIRYEIEKYFSPNITFYSLNQMFEKNYTSEQIFEGPTLENGFIDPAELEKASLRTEVRLSDIMQLIMQLDGVKVIRDISINDCDTITDKDNDVWILDIANNTKPVICEKSVFSFFKGFLPLNINVDAVKTYQKQLKNKDQESQALAAIGMDLEIPVGQYPNTEKTSTIQNDFPDTYGIGQSGLQANSSIARKSQAKQLKAYLLFFDQIFATYFAHLGKVKDILSVDNSLSNTYFTQAVKNIKGFKELVNEYPEEENALTNQLLSTFDDNIARKNKILDHLIARFSEKISEYSFLMKKLYGSSADKLVIEAKERFLAEYGDVRNTEGEWTNKGISNWRGSAFNYYQQPLSKLWDTGNVAGTQKRIARLSGMKNFNRRNLSSSFVEVYQLINSDGELVYRWRIKDNDGLKILSATEDYKTPRLAEREMHLAVLRVLETSEEKIKTAFEKELADEDEIGNIKIQISPERRYSFDVINREANSRGKDWIIARQFIEYLTKEELKKAILNTIKFFIADFTEEGIFIVEHILLNPEDIALGSEELGRSTNELPFIPVCCNETEYCQPIDPYSYRVTIVLPGWTYRFSNIDFRRFMEDLIRKELPAHILARICWIGDRQINDSEIESDMQLFENAFKELLITKSSLSSKISKSTLKDHSESITDFNSILTQLNSIYPVGKLIDCNDEDDDLKGRIVLGRTNIGNL